MGWWSPLSQRVCSKCKAKIERQKVLVTEGELKKLTRELKMLRDIQKSILASGAYGERQWLEQRRRLSGNHAPADERKVIDGLWKRRHDLAMVLKDKSAAYLREKDRLEKLLECCDEGEDDG